MFLVLGVVRIRWFFIDIGFIWDTCVFLFCMLCWSFWFMVVLVLFLVGLKCGNLVICG